MTEELAGNPDEGLKLFVTYFAKALSTTYEVQVSAQDFGKYQLTQNKFFLGADTLSLVRKTRPLDGVFYFPRATSATIGSIIRCWFLQRLFRTVSVALVALQQRHWYSADLFLAKFLWPRCVFLSTLTEIQRVSTFGLESNWTLPGVDNKRFKPVLEVERAAIRRQWGIDNAKPVILHVGHLKVSRNLMVLSKIKRSIDCDVLVVGSTTTQQETELIQQLEDDGVRIITEYIPNIEQMYQMADCYLFPVQRQDAAIAVPLSVLEAMACNLPVVSSPFGELPNLFPEENGLFYAKDDHEFVIKTERALKDVVNTDVMVLPLSWQNTARRMVRTFLPDGRFL